ncbi:MAG: HD domain-containing phosphohydrolase [Spirochaetota bacterium]
MKNILCINFDSREIRGIGELVRKNDVDDYNFLDCQDQSKLPRIVNQNTIHCILYAIRNKLYLEDLEYLRLVVSGIPVVVSGKKFIRKKDLLNLINTGTLYYFLSRPFSEYELMAALESALGYSDKVQQKYNRLKKQYFEQQIEKLNKIGIALSSEHNLERLLDQIVSQARFLAHCDGGSIYIRENDMLDFVVAQNDTLKKRHGDKYEEKFFKQFRFPMSKDRISGYVAITGETLNIEDVYNIPPEKDYKFKSDFDKRNNYLTKSMILAPMKDPSNNILGVLQLINCLDEQGNIIPFDKNLEGLIQSLASQAAVAIRNARLLQKVKEAHLDTILRLSMAAEFRDVDTADHLSRMTSYSMIIAKKLGLEEAKIELLRYAAPMHDIGKIGIPDSILLKKGKLNPQEWEEMKKHTQYGAQMLEGSDSEILKASRIVALNHHERWDAKGYPRGLKNGDIPILGQITSVADVFDALTSKRCYKQAYSLEYSIDEIKKSSNTMFGPDLVRAFLDGLKEIVEVYHSSDQKIMERLKV